MFVIIVYDVNSKRDGKVLKICRKYLNHVQNSVFEGIITDGQLNKLKREVERAIKTKEDQFCIYKFDSLRYTEKELLGVNIELGNIL